MAYTCGLAGGYVQFVVQSHGVLTACAVIGENTNMLRVHAPGYRWPVD